MCFIWKRDEKEEGQGNRLLFFDYVDRLVGFPTGFLDYLTGMGCRRGNSIKDQGEGRMAPVLPKQDRRILPGDASWKQSRNEIGLTK